MTWKDWQNKLHVFSEWRHQKHGPIVQAWWSYLFDTFFREISTVSNLGGLYLDIGCGHGAYLIALVKKGEGLGIGLDPIESSLVFFKNRIKDDEISRKIELIRGVGEYLPIREGCVSTSIMTGTLDHVNSPSETIGEIHRVLAPHSYFICLESALMEIKTSFYDETHVNQFTMADLKGLLTEFKIEGISKFYPVLSQIHVPDKLLDSFIFRKVLSKMPGLIGSYFNYSQVLIKSRKN